MSRCSRELVELDLGEAALVVPDPCFTQTGQFVRTACLYHACAITEALEGANVNTADGEMILVGAQADTPYRTISAVNQAVRAAGFDTVGLLVMESLE